MFFSFTSFEHSFLFTCLCVSPPAPPKVARPEVAKPEPEPPKVTPSPAAVAPKPSVASRLSRAESDTAVPVAAPAAAAPAVTSRPGVVPKPAGAKPAESSGTTTGSSEAAPVAFEKKKFSTPTPAAKPTTTSAPVEDELAKKLSARNAASEGGDTADSPVKDPPHASKPTPAAAEPAKPPLAARPIPQRPPVVQPQAAAPAPAPAVVVEPAPSSPADNDDSDEGDSHKLHHATKDRPRIGSNRRQPSRRSVSGIGNEGREESKEEPAAAAAPRLPERPVIADKAPPETKVPEKPKPAVGPSPAAVASRTNSSNSDGQTLAELKEFFMQKLDSLKRELDEERTIRRALEERVAKLEGGGR